MLSNTKKEDKIISIFIYKITHFNKTTESFMIYAQDKAEADSILKQLLTKKALINVADYSFIKMVTSIQHSQIFFQNYLIQQERLATI